MVRLVHLQIVVFLWFTSFFATHDKICIHTLDANNSGFYGSFVIMEDTGVFACVYVLSMMSLIPC